MRQKRTSIAKARIGRESVEVAAYLRGRILSGKLAAGEFLPTVRVLSETQGVAHATAWKILKALEDEGLIEARQRQGYCVTDPSRRTGAAATVAYVMDQKNLMISWDLIYRRLLNSIEENTSITNVRLLKVVMSPGQEDLVTTQLAASRLDGLVLDSLNDKLLRWAKNAAIPAAVMDDWAEDLPADSVVQGNYEGGELAARYLQDEGCQRIAWLGQTRNHHGRFRYGGALSAMAVAGRRFSHDVNGEISEASVYEQALRMLSGPDRPDGLIVFWYFAAAVRAARAANIHLGRDVKLVCWCPEEIVRESYVPIFEGFDVPPAVTWSIQSMAEIAVSRILERRRNPSLPVYSCRLPVKLVRPGR